MAAELPARYREHATRPDLLAVCIECSGNPEAVIPLDAVDRHEEWHAELATGRVSPGQEHPNGPWPELPPDRPTTRREPVNAVNVPLNVAQLLQLRDGHVVMIDVSEVYGPSGDRQPDQPLTVILRRSDR